MAAMNLPPVVYEENVDVEQQPCRDYSKGRCTRGPACRFRHVEGPLPPPAPRDDAVDLPPVSVFAPPPVAAVDLLEEEEEMQGLSDAVSDIVGLSEVQIANMTPEELLIHVEKRIRATEQAAQFKAISQPTAAPAEDGDTMMEDDLPPLPPLPTPTVPTLVQGIRLNTVYESLNELIKTSREDGLDLVGLAINEEEDDNLALAFVKVLREAGLAYHEGKPMGYPKIEPPGLPPGFTSWVVVETPEEKAARLRKERKLREEQLAKRNKRQAEYAKQLKISAQNRKIEQMQAEKFRTMKSRLADLIDRAPDVSEGNKEGAKEYLGGLENYAEMETVANLDSNNPNMDPSLLFLQQLLSQEIKRKA